MHDPEMESPPQSGIISSLPPEILSSIFMNVVYSPYNEHYPYTVRFVMHTRIRAIYRRVYTLLGVCRAWRDTGLACHSLWSVVPLTGPESHPQDSNLAKRILQRAGTQNLLLAVTPALPSHLKLEAISGHWQRFSAVNVISESRSLYEIYQVLKMVLTHGTPSSISKLSLRHISFGHRSVSSQAPLHSHFAKLGYQISEMINSLATLRIDYINIDWRRVSFTHRLVELLVNNMTLCGLAKVTAFLNALSSACELRDLTIVSSRMLLQEDDGNERESEEDDEDKDDQIIPFEISLPKLEYLHLERLDFTSLCLFLTQIGSGRYRLTLNPGDEIQWTSFYEMVDEEQICKLCKRAAPDKLILTLGEASLWESATRLRSLLESVPTIKTLVLNFFNLDRETLKALVPPPEETDPENKFPRLETLEFHHAIINTGSTGNLIKEFRELLRTKSIRRMVLGAGVYNPMGSGALFPLRKTDKVVAWLRDHVPEFYLSPCPEEALEQLTYWELWDI